MHSNLRFAARRPRAWNNYALGAWRRADASAGDEFCWISGDIQLRRQPDQAGQRPAPTAPAQALAQVRGGLLGEGQTAYWMHGQTTKRFCLVVEKIGRAMPAEGEQSRTHDSVG
jgi:hypothetical protein